MSDYTTHVYDENAVLRQRIAELEAALRGAREAIRKEISEEWECTSYHPSLTKAVFTIDKLLKD